MINGHFPNCGLQNYVKLDITAFWLNRNQISDMGFFDFFKTTPASIPADLSFIAVDMHNHLVPGIDDGSQDVDDSVRFVRQLHALGYRKLICTPHVISDLYPNTAETILPAFQLLESKLKAENIPVEIAYAAEFMVTSDFAQLVKAKTLLPFGGKHILVEMSYIAPSPNMREVIFELQLLGYQPVLAHPERYGYYHQNYKAIFEFIDAGCLFQLNLLSLTGAYGKRVKKMADMLIKDKLISFAGTDLHHERHLEMITELASNAEIIAQLQSLDLKNSEL